VHSVSRRLKLNCFIEIKFYDSPNSVKNQITTLSSKLTDFFKWLFVELLSSRRHVIDVQTKSLPACRFQFNGLFRAPCRARTMSLPFVLLQHLWRRTSQSIFPLYSNFLNNSKIKLTQSTLHHEYINESNLSIN
jgi:hypothetical protein